MGEIQPGSWADSALRRIEAACAHLPADASVEDRRKAILAERKRASIITSWGKKSWARARRVYLSRFEPPPAPLFMPESPLERQKRRGSSR